MENQQSSEKLPTSKAVIAYLAEQFPQCFIIEGEAKPLKIGIFDDLAERLADDPKVSKTRLRGALRQYTNSWRYLRCVTADAERVDLDGVAAGKVEKDHADHAAEALAESKAKAAEKRKQQAQQRATKAPANSNDAKAGDTQNTARKKRAKPPTKKTHPQRAGKASATKASKAEPNVALNLEQVQDSSVKVGQAVHVKLGQSPVAATVTAIEKSDISVQLSSGITVKVKAENLYTEA